MRIESRSEGAQDIGPVSTETAREIFGEEGVSGPDEISKTFDIGDL